ncbi:MAG: serine hydrolase [Clostridia bacterium]|nr:serine hydrolase [Clostridia bacterium]
MNYCTPEAVGISSADVLKFYQKLEERCLSTHDVIMARGDSIFTETYYAPFHKDFKHRMYSVSKSFVSIAIGFCEQDGLLSLDDPFSKYFAEYLTPEISEKVTDMTIREMLRMETGRATNTNWFETVEDDRCKTYLEISRYKYPNTLFDYDSTGSFMLGAIVEKVTGKPFLEYLKDKVLRDIGFSGDSYCLQAPGGHSWGDSAVMCTAHDLLLFARFVLNGGTWNGKRYLNEQYIRDAVDMKVCNNYYGFESPSGYGYGYQFWGLPHGCYGMFGMGIQLAVCDPAHDLIFVINSDNQGNDLRYAPIVYAFYDFIYDRIADAPLPENAEAYRALTDYTASLKLFTLRGPTESVFSDKINGKTYRTEPNQMGIQWFRLELDGDEGVFRYENAQGVKALRFGFGHNVFQKFPQTGYSDTVGAQDAPGHKYDCAVSADWPEERKLRIRVQIIDKYFANLAILIGFRDDQHVSVRMEKCAEDFLQEYTGWMNAKAE